MVKNAQGKDHLLVAFFKVYFKKRMIDIDRKVTSTTKLSLEKRYKKYIKRSRPFTWLLL